MKKTLLLTGILSAILSANSYLQNCDQIIDKQVIKICYDYKIKGPKAVVYTVDGKTVNKVNIKKRPRFYTEKTIPAKYRTKYSDYTHATSSKDNTISFDRGHLAPDADFDYDKKTLRKVYTMANIIPQVSVVNQKTWIKAERYERKIATKLGKVEVVNGVIYKDMDNYLVKKPLDQINTSKWKKNKFSKFKKETEKLKRKHIVIPSAFFKKITNKEKGFEKCFLYKNKVVDFKVDKLRNHEIDCSKLPRP